jgi:hypothetical protein
MSRGLAQKNRGLEDVHGIGMGMGMGLGKQQVQGAKSIPLLTTGGGHFPLEKNTSQSLLPPRRLARAK